MGLSLGINYSVKHKLTTLSYFLGHLFEDFVLNITYCLPWDITQMQIVKKYHVIIYLRVSSQCDPK